ncbi:hypothetical protein HO173_009300 [Letharia columbiana]|uniref:Uncharacterized protein n=1 Tax=Letharia columbiana TaxID=112416 RepID=A0A8H6FPP9_9LECA|nr:uncharacterized protein HO173_009300 [Letharia columbiana]KAF6232421.1 hypothetical protein HO173_009300 [Letharia columbiana]
MKNTAENITETVISSSDTTGLLSTVSHQSTQPVQEKSIQQANAENTTEKPSGNKAPSTKNTAQLSKIPRHMLSTVPHQIITPERCIFGRIETVRCLQLCHYSKNFTAAGDIVGFTPLIGTLSPFLSDISILLAIRT